MIHHLPNSSYYAASVDAFPAQPQLTGSIKADVCVVGAGFTGLAAALACAEKGLDTVLVEGHCIANGASGRNGGQMIPGLNVDAHELVSLLGREKAEALYRLATSARDRVHARIAQHGIECDLRPGHVHLAARKSDMQDFQREADFANALLGDGSAQIVAAGDVGQHVAVDGYHGALVTPAGGHMHPMKYAHGLATAALTAGVRIFEQSLVERIDDGHPALVRAAAGKVSARHILLGCDADMDQLDRAAASHTMPVFNYIIATEPLDEMRARALVPSGAAVSDSRFVLNYFRLSADNRMLFAGGEKYTLTPPHDIAAFVRPHMLKLFPSLADAAIDFAWGGAVGITVNRLPQFGRRHNRLFSHGYSGQGVLLATLAGELMANAITGKPDGFDQFAAIPHMPFPGGKLLRSPIYTAGMMYGAAGLAVIAAARIAKLTARERERFVAVNPRAVAAARGNNWFGHVPFHWMLDWPSPVPLVAGSAAGTTLTTIDGHTLDDFCLGDTASMFGHSPPALTAAIAEQAAQGLSYMLPTEKSDEVSALLAATFGLPRWQVTTTASEANRAVIRWCRGITGRRKILLFNGCYHGAVDDAFVDLQGGEPAMRASLIGQVHALRDTSVVIEFNDEAALEAALEDGDIACVLAEPVMTNVGMVRDAPGFLQRLRALCDASGTLLIFDETHTISSGFGGHSNAHGPMPDIMVIGKSIGGGVPTAVYGFTDAVAERMTALNTARPAGHSGIGTTLSANALAISAMHAMLSDVITRENYGVMLAGAERLVAGLAAVIARRGLPWHVTAVGARVELLCSPSPTRNGSEAKAAMQPALEALIHLFLNNCGSLLAPFHNMMLVSPLTLDKQIDHLVASVDALAQELLE